MFDAAERLAAIRLARSEMIGAQTFRALIDRHGSARAVVEAWPAISRESRARLAGEDIAQAEMARAEELGSDILIAGEPRYPALLAAAEPAPPILHVIGRLDLLVAPAVAVVGARNASANGRKLAHDLAKGLGAKGFVVVSGLARGIDTAAHKGALAAGTIAVLAGGVDAVYPEENRDLYGEIAEAGAIVSEMPPGHTARAMDFPRRNRIISGLCRGTVIVEAAERSGSLITARYALEQGRDVFAVPGSPLDARCRGTNRLIKEGAVLTECVEDITDNLAPAEPRLPLLAGAPRRAPALPRARTAPAAAVPLESGALDERLWGLLGASPIGVDDLVRLTGAEAAEVHAALLELELEGRLTRHPGHQFSRPGA